jgi:hypothetical protein
MTDDQKEACKALLMCFMSEHRDVLADAGRWMTDPEMRKGVTNYYVLHSFYDEGRITAGLIPEAYFELVDMFGLSEYHDRLAKPKPDRPALTVVR